MTVAAGRERREEARDLIADGVDPSENRKSRKAAKAESAANSFETIAREWFAKFGPEWLPGHGDKTIRRLARDIFPWIGARPIADVTAPELLKVPRRIEERGSIETAHLALQNCGQILRYAIATGRAERDVTADLRSAATCSMLFVGPGELRSAEWAHINLVAGEWRYTATNTDTEHIVRLSTQAVALLRELQPLPGPGR